MSRTDAIGGTGEGALILLYHRVTHLPTDPQLLAVHPARFRQHLEILKRHASVISLRQLAIDVRENRVRPRTVCLTFDDGYADNFLEAARLLRRADVPATVFATTAHGEDGREFFWDELDRVFLQPGNLPHDLSLRIAGEAIECELAEAAYPDDLWQDRRAWNVEMPAPPSAASGALPRQELYRTLCGRLHRCTVEQRRSSLTDLRSWAGAGETGRGTHRMMSPAQLRELASDGLVEVGAHTVNHPLLSVETAEVQEREIRTNLRQLESILGRPVQSFSYPFGCRRDYTPQTVEIVRGLGFACACSNFRGRVNGATDPMQLPRHLVRDWPAEVFEENLAKWLQQ